MYCCSCHFRSINPYVWKALLELLLSTAGVHPTVFLCEDDPSSLVHAHISANRK